MTERRFLAGCLVLASALSLPAASGQAVTSPARSPAPAPATAPAIVTPTPTLPAPVIAPPPVSVPAPVTVRREATYDFESDTVEGDLARPEGAAVAAAPPEVPAYSDLCKASPRPPWCADSTAPKDGN